MSEIKVLSVRQPWAWALIYLKKDIENRSRCYAHRGQTLIHASAGMTEGEYERAIDFMAEIGIPRGKVPDRSGLQFSGIIGIVDIVDSVTSSNSPWWIGPCGLVCRNPRPLPFYPCKGTISPMFWTPPAEVLAHL